jgi:hypothetical protein
MHSGQDAELQTVKAGGTYSNHRVSKIQQHICKSGLAHTSGKRSKDLCGEATSG